MRRWPTTIAVLSLLGIVMMSGAVQADGKTSAQCGREFDQCQNACNADPHTGAATRAPCVAKCSGLYAACDAGVAYEKAKPWIEDQAKKTKRFFEELIEKYGTQDKATPPKKDKPKSI